jgi:chitinase
VIEADIKTCQANGKKILLSLGGGTAGGFYVASQASAVAFADFLWGAFGPQKSDWVNAGQPRPFGDVVIDGFDFDIEANPSEVSTPLGFGWADMANELRRLFALETGTYYLSVAPQCIVPDANLADALSGAPFDFVFVQFYNTPICSARAGLDHTYGQTANGGQPTDISFDAWVSWVLSNSANPTAKIYMGLPAAPGAANDAAMYLDLADAQNLTDKFQSKYPSIFGGVMLWEATFSEQNQINNQSYAANMKSILTENSCATPNTTTNATISSSPAMAAVKRSVRWNRYSPALLPSYRRRRTVRQLS